MELALLDAGGVLLLPEVDQAITALHEVGADVDEALLDRGHYEGMAAADEILLGMELPAGGVTAEVWSAGPREAYRAAKRAALKLDGPLPPSVESLLFESPWTRVAPGAVKALRSLAELGVPIAVVSNAGGTIEAELKAARICQVGAGEGVCVAAVIDSTIVGVAKPDPRIFRFALDAAGMTAERAVFVGDSVAIDVQGARRAGIRASHYDPYRLCEGRGHHDIRDLSELIEVLAP